LRERNGIFFPRPLFFFKANFFRQKKKATPAKMLLPCNLTLLWHSYVPQLSATQPVWFHAADARVESRRRARLRR
jgi:hypothetical protein